MIKKISKYAVAALLVFPYYALSAAPPAPQAGTDFVALQSPPAPVKNGRAEVIEFFSYFCKHCREFETPLHNWAVKHAGKIEVVRVPANFGKHPELHQRLYYSLAAMGKADALQSKIFNRFQRGEGLDTVEQIENFVVAEGIDKRAFAAVFDSQAVKAKVARANELQAAYQVKGVPVLVVGGRYMTSPAFFQKKRGILEQLVDAVSPGGARAADEVAAMQRTLDTAEVLADMARKTTLLRN